MNTDRTAIRIARLNGLMLRDENIIDQSQRSLNTYDYDVQMRTQIRAGLRSTKKRLARNKSTLAELVKG